MGIRKNAKFLTAAEREAFVKACVLLKADIVNPGAPVADQYSRWDELTALHRMIQNAFSPLGTSINFGHGGLNCFSFLSWHRFLLLHVERLLQAKVPGVTIPYWDWTDPAPLMTDTFLGPNGDTTGVVRRGYFAATAPGVGANTTPAPGWWPAGLSGWLLPPTYDINAGYWIGPLRRRIGAPGGLPSVADVRDTLAMLSYSKFQLNLEGGNDLPSHHQMHNAMHVWVGGEGSAGWGHMRHPDSSPHDPFFYLHHANIDRLWAMWQADGHSTEYPSTGGKPGHNRLDLMYPWVGTEPGFGTNVVIGAITMPDFSALGPQANAGMLDHRGLGYTYDTMPIVGIELDRSGSMAGVTPDPMTTGAPPVTKWVAATQGVASFLQDCEVARDSGVAYVTAGVRTFRSLRGNVFESVFAGTPYGLVKPGTPISRAGFEAQVSLLAPTGGTPLADALTDGSGVLVEPPAPRVAGERRYLSLLTDGVQTSGSPLASIPDGSLAGTVVFAMGFGTGLDVDYPTLAQLTAKGEPAGFDQVFHGENAGTVDKFYGSSVARAIGFTPIIDPVLDLFEGEHAHFTFSVTSADDSLLLTVQGMDFDDAGWTYMLMGPDGAAVYGDSPAHSHGSAPGGHGGRRPSVTAARGGGRLTLIVQRDGADQGAWVGAWQVMVGYHDPTMDGMVMLDVGALTLPVAAGPVRGPRWSAGRPGDRRVPATRDAGRDALADLSVPTLSTNRSDGPACSVVINVYARTRLALELAPESPVVVAGEAATFELTGPVDVGSYTVESTVGRVIGPVVDIEARAREVDLDQLGRRVRLPARLRDGRYDNGRVLAELEAQDPNLGSVRDEQARVVQHDGGPPHVHVADTSVPGGYHLGLLVSGRYFPDRTAAPDSEHHHPGFASDPGPDGDGGEPFTRILTASLGAVAPPR
jgi:Common central domain of tyrosinase